MHNVGGTSDSLVDISQFIFKMFYFMNIGLEHILAGNINALCQAAIAWHTYIYDRTRSAKRLDIHSSSSDDILSSRQS